MNTSMKLILSLITMLLLPVVLEAQNPRLVKDIYAGLDSGLYGFRNMNVTRDVVNGMFFISADDGITGTEAWTSVAPYENASTALVKDLAPGLNGWGKRYTSAYDKLYFISPGNGAWDALCRSDGSSAGTSVLWAPTVKNGQYQRIEEICAAQTTMFVLRMVQSTTSAYVCPLSATQYEVWKMDRTTGAATLLKSEIRAGQFADVNGTFVFRGTYKGKVVQCAYVGDHALYKSNGTAKGTAAYYVLPRGGSVTLPWTNNHPYHNGGTGAFIVAGAKLYFLWKDAAYGSELYVTDGTVAGSGRVTDINPGPANADPAMGAVMNDYLYFAARDAAIGYQIWRYPLAGGTAQRVTSIDGGAAGADPMWLTPAGGWLYFSAYTPSNGRELWRTNGLPYSDPAAVTELVMDINGGATSSNPNYTTYQNYDKKYMLSMAVIGNTVYFPADDGTGYALWRCTGTAVEKLGGVNPRTLTAVHWLENNEPRDAILFAAYSESEGVELWKYEHWLSPSPKRGRLEGTPLAFALSQNYPNPFNPSTVIRYEIPEADHVRLAVYDLHGREIAVLVDSRQSAGMHAAEFTAGQLAGGTYTYRLTTKRGMLTRCMSLVK